MQWFNQWRKRITDWSHAFDNIWAAFRLVFQASPVATLVMLAVTILEGLLVPAQAWMHKLVADRAIELFQAGTDPWNGFLFLLPLFAVEVGLMFADLVSVQGRSLVERILNFKLNFKLWVDFGKIMGNGHGECLNGCSFFGRGQIFETLIQ